MEWKKYQLPFGHFCGLFEKKPFLMFHIFHEKNSTNKRFVHFI